MRNKKGGRKRKRHMRWVEIQPGKWEHVDMNDKKLRHEMGTINQRKKS